MSVLSDLRSSLARYERTVRRRLRVVRACPCEGSLGPGGWSSRGGARRSSTRGRGRCGRRGRAFRRGTAAPPRRDPGGRQGTEPDARRLLGALDQERERDREREDTDLGRCPSGQVHARLGRSRAPTAGSRNGALGPDQPEVPRRRRGPRHLATGVERRRRGRVPNRDARVRQSGQDPRLHGMPPRGRHVPTSHSGPAEARRPDHPLARPRDRERAPDDPRVVHERPPRPTPSRRRRNCGSSQSRSPSAPTSSSTCSTSVEHGKKTTSSAPASSKAWA